MAGVSEGAAGLPDPRLRAYVTGYSGYLLRGFAPGTHIGMPGAGLTVIITIDEPIHVPVSAQPGQPGGHWDMLASGLTVRPAVIAHNGFQHGVQLNVTPLGCRALFGMPTAALGSWLVDLTDVLGPRAIELRERLSSQSGWPQRFAVIDEILLRQLHPADWDAELAHAWALLSGPDPAVRVAAVADEIGWSRRHLGNRFAAELGITPKDAARVARFGRSHRLMREPGRVLAEVAAVAGYYDQAHMAREWRELAGMPPSVWLEHEEFPFVQDQQAVEAGG
ncbi:helix-turn-helix domain-containing protein [Nocardia heshunensis]